MFPRRCLSRHGQGLYLRHCHPQTQYGHSPSLRRRHHYRCLSRHAHSRLCPRPRALRCGPPGRQPQVPRHYSGVAQARPGVRALRPEQEHYCPHCQGVHWVRQRVPQDVARVPE